MSLTCSGCGAERETLDEGLCPPCSVTAKTFARVRKQEGEHAMEASRSSLPSFSSLRSPAMAWLGFFEQALGAVCQDAASVVDSPQKAAQVAARVADAALSEYEQRCQR